MVRVKATQKWLSRIHSNVHLEDSQTIDQAHNVPSASLIQYRRSPHLFNLTAICNCPIEQQNPSTKVSTIM